MNGPMCLQTAILPRRSLGGSSGSVVNHPVHLIKLHKTPVSVAIRSDRQERSRPAAVLCFPLYAASGDAGELGTDPNDDARELSSPVDVDGGIVYVRVREGVETGEGVYENDFWR